MEYLKRGKLLNKVDDTKVGPVIYWMSRDQRVHDNWALLAAQDYAIKKQVPFFVVFNLINNFLNAGVRQFGFLLRGLKELKDELAEFNIPFILLNGEPDETIPRFVKENNISYIFSDFDPLRIKLKWKKSVIQLIDIPFCDIDAHNIIPCTVVSDKQEFSAHTFRQKVYKVLHNWLEEFPPVQKMPSSNYFRTDIDWNEFIQRYRTSVPEVNWITPGERNVNLMLENFISKGIKSYTDNRNDPTKNAQSNLSPYLHYGHLSTQRIVLNLQKSKLPPDIKEAFLEELIIRKELSDNFCFYNSNYDSFEGFPDWAKNTLNEHRQDEREFIYSTEQFESAGTHEDLWNAAQMEMVTKGKMHGYMRMYWAKKILEWSPSPEEAMRIAIYLNDKYELDGRDPNGYTGIAWSIGGVHDRAWAERPVYGKIRYMNRNGAKSKFDIDHYIASNPII